MWHIIDRAIYHFGWAAVLFGIFFGLLTYWMKHNRKVQNWLTNPVLVRFIIAALICAALMPFREPYDVMFGNQSNVKTPFDQLEWIIFPGFWAWIAYRIWKFIETRKTK